MKTPFTLFAACVLALGAGTALAEPKCGDESRKQQLCENCEGLVAFEVIGRNYRLLSATLPSQSKDYATAAQSVGQELAALNHAQPPGQVQTVCVVGRLGVQPSRELKGATARRARDMAKALERAGVTGGPAPGRSKRPRAVVALVE